MNKLNKPTDRIGRSLKKGGFPVLTINNAYIAKTIDEYIRVRLFDKTIEPSQGKNWKVLLLPEVMQYIIGQISSAIIASQEETEEVGDTVVVHSALSSANKITVREKYCIELKKCIYEKCPFPSNRGEFERAFMAQCDLDGEVDAICKVIENRHTFVRFRYVREDGMPAEYIPDFMVRIGADAYLVETKAQDQRSHPNVVRKKRSALRWVERINNLPPGKRDDLTWHYVVLDDTTFYEWKRKNASIKDMLDYSEIRNNEEINFTGRFNI